MCGAACSFFQGVVRTDLGGKTPMYYENRQISMIKNTILSVGQMHHLYIIADNNLLECRSKIVKFIYRCSLECLHVH